MIRLEPGDCLDVIPKLVSEGRIVDAICTDPPYDLIAMAKRFGKPSSAPAQRGNDGAMARLSGGFRGLQWDSTGIAFRPETWATIATILRPGGFLLAFGGTRTAHRMVSAIEDAGFIIQDTIMWLYATGFPKRRDMLKPAYEPVCVAYKPGGKRTLQVDECRISGMESTIRPTGSAAFWNRSGNIVGGSEAGRWPANVIHDGSDEVMETFAAFGSSQSGKPRNDRGKGGVWSESNGTPCSPQYGDEGSISRYFYSAKADGEDRWGSRHPTVKPVELIKYLVKLACPPDGTFLDPFAGSGTAAVAAIASGRNAILIEQEPQYCADIRERIAHYEGAGRHSLSVKARNRQPQETQGTLI